MYPNPPESLRTTNLRDDSAAEPCENAIRTPSDPDRSDPARPISVTPIVVSGPQTFVDVVDVEDLRSPRIRARIRPIGQAWSADSFGRRLFVADARYGVHVWDASDPSQPRYLGGNTAMNAISVAASAIGMDKPLFKRFARAAGLPVLDWVEIAAPAWARDRAAAVSTCA